VTAAGVRDPELTTMDVVAAFNDAFNRHDADGLRALMTDDCVFVDTSPPEGVRHEGVAAASDAFESLFVQSPRAHFDAHLVLVAGDRVVQGWRYSWGDGHVDGVDILRVRDGRVAEKCSYVKG
jgi:ketosteroid isomerase-like protein